MKVESLEVIALPRAGKSISKTFFAKRKYPSALIHHFFFFLSKSFCQSKTQYSFEIPNSTSKLSARCFHLYALSGSERSLTSVTPCNASEAWGIEQNKTAPRRPEGAKFVSVGRASNASVTLRPGITKPRRDENTDASPTFPRRNGTIKD